MRFSLFAFLAAATLLAISLAMIIPHGFFGVVLLLPHILAVVSVALLIRRTRWLIASLVAATYITCWAATGVLGVPNVRDDIRSQVTRKRYAHPRDHGVLKRVDYDPVIDDSKPYVEAPWHFVGNESSPCPFVVTVDYSFMSNPSHGGGGKVYILWFFGYQWIINARFYWSS
ncbi:MAG: hypothetical protein ACYTG0_45265 [Planctomycetota bacterium]|jgi:hypothetical protein